MRISLRMDLFIIGLISLRNTVVSLDLTGEGDAIGARVSQDEYEKDNLGDFALWKAYVEKDGDVFGNHHGEEDGLYYILNVQP